MLRSSTSGLRSFFAALVALPLLLAGPALAAGTNPATATHDGILTARRVPMGRPAAVAKRTAPTKSAAAKPAPTKAADAAPKAVATVAEPAATKMLYLTGTVLGADGRPCPGACVFPTNNTHHIAVTDAKGSFQLQVPAGVPLKLQADYFGLGSSRVALDGQQAQPVRITLGQ